MGRQWFPLTGQSDADFLTQSMCVATFARDTLDFEPDAAQSSVLTSLCRRIALNCNRQFGKSTIAAIILAHRAVFQAGSLSIILAPCERQAAETLSKVLAFCNTARVRLVSDKVTRHGVRLAANGSRIIALPAIDANIRGFSNASLLVVDEASRVPDPLYHALRPSLAIGRGDIVLVSTPLGKRGFFYNEFTSTSTNWHRLTVPASQCPRITAEFLNEERLIGEEYFAQEYECQFVEDGRFLFTDADCKRLFKSDIEPLKLVTDRNTNPIWQYAMKPVHQPVGNKPKEE
jgi:hypothetical protein